MIAALDELENAMRDMIADAPVVLARINTLRALRDGGASYREIVTGKDRPVLEMLSTLDEKSLQEAEGDFRRLLARALRRDGMTMQDIADLFRVSRQRVSAMLAERHET